MNGIHAAFTGRLGGDAQVRTTRAGKPWAAFPVAVDTTKDAEAGTAWVKVALFGDSVDELAPRLTKGCQVYVEGRLTLRPWTDGDGKARPAMATIPDALILCFSTPYARRGVLWNAYRQHFGKAGDVLVWQAPTRAMNPTVSQNIIDSVFEEDPIAAAAEYGAEFRSDVEAFITQEAVDACMVPGRFELPPVAGTQYIAFVDPSGGSQDSMTLGIAHGESDRAVLDLVRERKPPFSPEAVVKEFAEDLKRYNIHEVFGDKYGGEWPRERFLTHGIMYRIADKMKSELYQSALPLLNSGRAELLDHKTLRTQLVGLERRTSRGGKDSIDHRPGGRDDVANSVAGALISCTFSVAITPDAFARGTISFVRPETEERNLWGQRPGAES